MSLSSHFSLFNKMVPRVSKNKIKIFKSMALFSCITICSFPAFTMNDEAADPAEVNQEHPFPWYSRAARRYNPNSPFHPNAKARKKPSPIAITQPLTPTDSPAQPSEDDDLLE